MVDNNNSFNFGDMLKNFEKQTAIKPNSIINAMVLCFRFFFINKELQMASAA